MYETVDVLISETHSATIAFRAIHSVHPETIFKSDGLTAKRCDVVTIVTDGHVFHVDPQEGERVRSLWKKWVGRKG